MGDSVSDGPVSATLQIGGQGLPVIPAWVVVTVPRYAPGIYGIVTWYDQAVSMARTGADGTFDQPRTTSFTHDIYPILKRADNLSAVHGTAHANGALKPLSDSARLSAFKNVAERSKVLSKLTTVETAAPGPQQVPPGRMPQLFSGANPDPAGPTWIYLSLTTRWRIWRTGPTATSPTIGPALPLLLSRSTRFPSTAKRGRLLRPHLRRVLADRSIPELKGHTTSRARRHTVPSLIYGASFALIRPIELDQEYASYRSTRASYYRMEMRWPQSAFWSRRHGSISNLNC
jgi:hypothetical protein